MLSLVGCSPNESLLSGKLYYAVSNRIMEADLESKKRRKIFEAPHYTLFGYASQLNASKIVLQVISADKGYPIQSFDTINKQFESLAEGSMPTFISQSNIIFYYKYKNKGDTISLYMMNVDDKKEVLVKEGTKEQNTEPGTSFYINLVYPVVPISSSEIIFINIDRELEIYNYMEKKFKKTGIKGFIPFVWRRKNNTLVCRHIDSKDYYELNIQKSTEKKIPNLNRVTGSLLYIPDYDCIIYTKYRKFSLSERTDIYAHWLSNNKENKLWSNDRIVSAVWIKN